ncbi:glycosyltransferase family protein [Roseococcus suduntuyensis]|uniref:Glycosyltransferase involved in cell wall biosynthesis n=1 Tax=Roseococcus suduntuyensis TaxID=455361 RepID=A0A840AGM8_9PROT|nr:hypothetical protein [Roseococcus suduntuyensis]MBB3900231.1 glycosyltransferase involved in cell wall biosynthesis [Roseococcus suduntuyensis]
MKTLLLTDIPPCTNYTAGIVTAQMCRAVPAGQLAVFNVQNPHLTPELCADLAQLPMVTVHKPNEFGVRRWRGLPITTLGQTAVEFRKRMLRLRPIIAQALEFGRAQEVDNLWCVLQGQTMLRLALPVARGLGVPLRLHLWDPLEWWHRAHRVDRLNAWLDRRLFDRVMRAGESCASASWAMTEHFARRYGLRGEPVIAALDTPVQRRPEPVLHRPDTLTIGMAGQFYAEAEWLTLVSALTHAKWRVAGRTVRLLAMGGSPPPGAIPSENLDFRGWQPQAEVVRLLAEEADLLYCGYPFGAEMEQVSRLSFPSKLPTYFAAGRPVLFHGRADSSPATYLARRAAAWIVAQPDAASLHSALLNLAEDEAAFARFARAASAAFEADFTLETQRAAVRRFLGL